MGFLLFEKFLFPLSYGRFLPYFLSKRSEFFLTLVEIEDADIVVLLEVVDTVVVSVVVDSVASVDQLTGLTKITFGYTAVVVELSGFSRMRFGCKAPVEVILSLLENKLERNSKNPRVFLELSAPLSSFS